MKSRKATNPRLVPVGVIAECFRISPRAVQLAVREGTLPPPVSHGRYDIVEAVHAWLGEDNLGRREPWCY